MKTAGERGQGGALVLLADIQLIQRQSALLESLFESLRLAKEGDIAEGAFAL